MEKFIDAFQNHASLAGVIAATGAFILSLVTKILTGQVSRKFDSLSVEFANEKLEDREREIDFESDTRLNEARYALKRQELSASLNKWSSNSLVFGQYVVGGVLASSFIQSALSKEMVGLLGVLVLVSSLIHQKFRPDVQYRNAKERASLLRNLIRMTEDDIYDVRTSRPGAKTVHAIREVVSTELSKIEALELADVAPGSSHVARGRSQRSPDAV